MSYFSREFVTNHFEEYEITSISDKLWDLIDGDFIGDYEKFKSVYEISIYDNVKEDHKYFLVNANNQRIALKKVAEFCYDMMEYGTGNDAYYYGNLFIDYSNVLRFNRRLFENMNTDERIKWIDENYYKFKLNKEDYFVKKDYVSFNDVSYKFDFERKRI